MNIVSEAAASHKTPEAMDTATAVEKIEALRQNIERVFRGKPHVVELTLTCVLARGHLLLEDVPGVGKTTLALALARSLGMKFRRIQFTSDMLPSDIIGVSVWNQKTGEFTFSPGPLFSELVLADEINRTTPRTQSALLEAMSEGKVSVDNVTHDLPSPFHVIATQNPLENYGTYPLPESQLDRFLMRLSIGYPGEQIERELLLSRGVSEPVESLESVVEPSQLALLQQVAADVKMEPVVAEYIMAAVEKTRGDERIRIGVSTRGALALARAVRALALVRGRDFCIPDDARELLVPCFAHRCSLGASSRVASRQEAEVLLEEVLSEVPVPA